MRKHFIDNLRNLCILLLFPYHTCRIYTRQNFYIHADTVMWCEWFYRLTSPWFMPLMFFIAGISAFYSLNKRSTGQFCIERIKRLLIPALSGILLIVPVQTYFAERFHNGYTGGFFAQWKVFFTKATDLTGYEGGFTPAHLWFPVVLFIVSIAALPVLIHLHHRNSGKQGWSATPVFLTSALGLLMIAGTLPEIGGKNGIRYLVLLLLGACMASDDTSFEIVRKYRAVFLLILTASTIIYADSYGIRSGKENVMMRWIFYHCVMWSAILTFTGYGHQYLNACTSFTMYFNHASFPIYVIHQTILVLNGYYILAHIQSMPVQYGLIITGSFAGSILCYELLKRIPGIRFLFGIKGNIGLSSS